jgi:hypothetical protein
MTNDQHDITIRVYITACGHDYLPTKRDVENGAEWCVHATSLPMPPPIRCCHSIQSWKKEDKEDGRMFCDDCGCEIVQNEDGYWYRKEA